MTPHSPGTDQISTLLSIGLVAAAIVVVAINLALFYAVRKNRAQRGSAPRASGGGRRVQFRVGALLTVFALAIFVVSLVLLYLVGARGILLLAVAAVLSAAVSFVLLARQREAMAGNIARRFTGFRQRLDEGAKAEDSD